MIIVQGRIENEEDLENSRTRVANEVEVDYRFNKALENNILMIHSDFNRSIHLDRLL